MDAERAFTLLSLVVLPWWAVWIVAPRSRWAQRAASHGAVFVALAAVYTALLGATFASSEVAVFDFESMRTGLSQPVGFLAGWTHYLCFDLFVGAWILRESQTIDTGYDRQLSRTILEIGQLSVELADGCLEILVDLS